MYSQRAQCINNEAYVNNNTVVVKSEEKSSPLSVAVVVEVSMKGDGGG